MRKHITIVNSIILVFMFLLGCASQQAKQKPKKQEVKKKAPKKELVKKKKNQKK